MIGSDSPGHGPHRRGGPAHLADRARDEAPRGARCPATAPADNRRARRYVAKYTICPAVAHGLDARDRLGRGRQARRPGAVGPGVLRRAAPRGGQGRGHRLGADGRRQRLDPHARSRCSPARCSAPRRGRRPRRACTFVAPAALERRASPTGSALRRAAGAGAATAAVADQGRPARQRRPARRRASTPTPSPSRIDGELVEAGPGHRAAHGPAVLPVLMPMRLAGPLCCCSPTGGSRPAATPTRPASRRRSPTGGCATWRRSAAFVEGRLRTAGLVDAALAAATRAAGAADGRGAAVLDARRRGRRPHRRRRRCGRRPAGSAASSCGWPAGAGPTPVLAAVADGCPDGAHQAVALGAVGVAAGLDAGRRSPALAVHHAVVDAGPGRRAPAGPRPVRASPRSSARRSAPSGGRGVAAAPRPRRRRAARRPARRAAARSSTSPPSTTRDWDVRLFAT